MTAVPAPSDGGTVAAMRRLCLSNLEIELRELNPGALAGLWHGYARFPSWKNVPDLVIEIERLAALPAAHAPDEIFPAFARERAAAGGAAQTALRLRRYDAWGEISRGADGRYVARFTVGPSANSLEACLRIAISAALPSTGAILMHSSAVKLGGAALVFSGVSGAGKSTISELLATREGLEKLADELLLLQSPRAPGQAWSLVVAPFLGAAGLPHGASLPLTAVHMLIQAPAHRKRRMPAGEALREVMKHILVYTGLPGTAEAVLGVAARLCAEVPVYALEFELTTPLRPILSPPAADSRQSS
ncbi:MAG: hypothetical protein IPL79_13620 [Myxococcales bacterium]|nr:hypothetical protein [Myxococcales bacterium]